MLSVEPHPDTNQQKIAYINRPTNSLFKIFNDYVMQLHQVPAVYVFFPEEQIDPGIADTVHASLTLCVLQRPRNGKAPDTELLPDVVPVEVIMRERDEPG